ncbi:MAG: hypothetical protein K5930_12365 [Treponemataceae bacterium]|nr:hypothetical protein [Treponemataceae bacterium]
MSFTKKSDVKAFIANNVRPAFEELKEAFAEKEMDVEIHEGKAGPISIELLIRYDKLRNFKYGVMAEKQNVPQYIIDEDNAPTPERKSEFHAFCTRLYYNTFKSFFALFKKHKPFDRIYA